MYYDFAGYCVPGDGIVGYGSRSDNYVLRGSMNRNTIPDARELLMSQQTYLPQVAKDRPETYEDAYGTVHEVPEINPTVVIEMPGKDKSDK